MPGGREWKKYNLSGFLHKACIVWQMVDLQAECQIKKFSPQMAFKF